MKKVDYKKQYSSLRFARSLILFEMNVGRKSHKETALLLKAVCAKLHPSCSFSESGDIYESTTFGGWIIKRTMKINKLDGMQAMIITDKFNALPKSQPILYLSKSSQKDNNFSWYAGQLRHEL